MPLPKSLTTVTPFSRYLALSLFVILPLSAFIYGVYYQKNIDLTAQQIKQDTKTTAFNSKQILSPNKVTAWATYTGTGEAAPARFSIKYPANWYRDDYY